jgi:hypothetical protein
LKEVDRFKCGRANFLVAEAFEKRAGDRLQMLEAFGVGGQNVFGAANGLELGQG